MGYTHMCNVLKESLQKVVPWEKCLGEFFDPQYSLSSFCDVYQRWRWISIIDLRRNLYYSKKCLKHAQAKEVIALHQLALQKPIFMPLPGKKSKPWLHTHLTTPYHATLHGLSKHRELRASLILPHNAGARSERLRNSIHSLWKSLKCNGDACL